MLRQNAHESHYDLNDLARLDDRVAARLDSIAVADEYGVDVVHAALENAGNGVVFAAVVRAIEEKNQ